MTLRHDRVLSQARHGAYSSIGAQPDESVALRDDELPDTTLRQSGPTLRQPDPTLRYRI